MGRRGATHRRNHYHERNFDVPLSYPQTERALYTQVIAHGLAIFGDYFSCRTNNYKGPLDHSYNLKPSAP